MRAGSPGRSNVARGSARVVPDSLSPIPARRNQSIQRLEWTHGEQFHASVARDALFASSVHLPPLSTDHRALWASLPTCPMTTYSAEKFHAALGPFAHDSASAGNCWTCVVTMDQRIGLMKPRGTPAEVSMRSRRLWHRQMTQRRIEVIANGVPFWGIKQVATDQR